MSARAQTLAELRGWSPAIVVQLEYSLLERTVEGELVPMAQELGMGVMPWSPLRNGYLTGKHARGSADARGGIVPGPTDAEWAVIDVLAQVAADAETTMAAAALAWVHERPGVASTVIGARSVGQLQANLDSLALELSNDQLERINGVSTPSLNFRPSTTRGSARCSPSGE